MKKLDQIVNFFFIGASILEASYNSVDGPTEGKRSADLGDYSGKNFIENNGITNGRRN